MPTNTYYIAYAGSILVPEHEVYRDHHLQDAKDAVRNSNPDLDDFWSETIVPWNGRIKTFIGGKLVSEQTNWVR